MHNKLIVAITGSAGRLGSAFAQALTASGAGVLLGDIDEKLGKEKVSQLESADCIFELLDTCSILSIHNFLASGINKFGRIDAVVHAAYPKSPQWGTPFGQLKEEYLSRDLFGQLGGAILVSQEAIKYFEKLGHGNLIHISSIQGIGAPKFEHYQELDMHSPLEYSAIKAGIINMCKYLAKYSQGKNIRVNCISPGGILDNQPEIFRERYTKECSTKGMLDPKDICGALLFLLSEDSMYINGQNIIVDDGWSL